jgi:hypothetical protein
MKGISPMLSLALTILLTTSATVLVLTTLKPTLDKAKAYSIFNEGIQNLELLSSAIKEVASEAEGSKRTISITVSDGEYKINSAYDWLYFEYDPPTDLGLAGRRGSIWIERGLEFADWFNGYAENSLPYSFYNLSGSWKIVNERLEGEKGLAFFNLSKKLPGFSFSANLENSDGQGEVFVSPVNPQNLTLFLPFDEGSGTIAYDFSGNENNGTLYNGSTICSGQDCPNWVDGKFGKALSFDGINDYVKVSSFPISEAISIAYWKKNSTDLAWHFVVNSSGKIYVDGSQANEKIFISFAGSDLIIGNSSDGVYYNGTLDEVRIYNYALSQDEIITLNNSSPLSVKAFPAQKFLAISQKKLNVLRNLSYEKLREALGEEYKFRIEIRPE